MFHLIFSKVARAYLKLDAGEDFLQLLYSSLINSSSTNQLICVCSVLSDLFTGSEVSQPYLVTVIEAIFAIVRSQDLGEEVSNSCLSVVRSLISNMNEFLSDDSLVGSLLTILYQIALIQNSRSGAFYCLSDLVDQFYPILEQSPIDLFELSFQLFDSNNRNDLLSICDFWSSIAQSECDPRSFLGIISKYLERLFPILCKLASSCPCTLR